MIIEDQFESIYIESEKPCKCGIHGVLNREDVHDVAQEFFANLTIILFNAIPNRLS